MRLPCYLYLILKHLHNWKNSKILLCGGAHNCSILSMQPLPQSYHYYFVDYTITTFPQNLDFLVKHYLFQNGNAQNPFCEKIDGVLAAYYHSIQTVRLYGKFCLLLICDVNRLQDVWFVHKPFSDTFENISIKYIDQKKHLQIHK